MPCVCAIIQQLKSVGGKKKCFCFLNAFGFEEGKEATAAFAGRSHVRVRLRDARAV